MTSDYYNPFDILKDKEVKCFLSKEIEDCLSDKTFSKTNIQSYSESYAFSKFVTGPNPLGAFSSFLDWGVKRILRNYLREQINYVDLYKDRFIEELRNCLIVSAIIVNSTSSMKRNTTSHITWGVNTLKYSLLKLSFSEGFEAAAEKVDEKEKNYLWDVLRFPITLYLNHKFLNKVAPSPTEEYYFKDLLNQGLGAYDIKELCLLRMLLLNNDNITNYTKINYSKLRNHLLSNKNDFSSMESLMKGLDMYKDMIVDIGKPDYE